MTTSNLAPSSRERERRGEFLFMDSLTGKDGRKFLLAIFGGAHDQKVPCCQTIQASKSYLTLFREYCLGSKDPHMIILSEKIKTIMLVENALTFFPEYGCVLFACGGLDHFQRATYRLHLLCLDSWMFFEHNNSDFCSRNQKVATLFAGCTSTLPTFVANIERKLSDAKNKTGTKRSAAEHNKGHQKTPAFIMSLICDELEGRTDNLHQPRGGFTDVGQHTGGSSRDTSWPLARAVIEMVVKDIVAETLPPEFMEVQDEQDMANSKHFLFEKVMISFELSLLEKITSAWLPENLTKQRQVNDRMAMLDFTSSRILTILDKGQAVHEHADRLVTCRKIIDECVAKAARGLAEKYVFEPLPGSIAGVRGGVTKVTLREQRRVANPCRSNLETSRQSALKNLCTVEVMEVDDCNAENLLEWVKRMTPSLGGFTMMKTWTMAAAGAGAGAGARAEAGAGARAGAGAGAGTEKEKEKEKETVFPSGSHETILVLCSLDRWFYARAARMKQREVDINAMATSKGDEVSSVGATDIDDVSALEALVLCYRSLLAGLMESDWSKGRLSVELESRGKLIAMIAVCLGHQAASVRHPLLRGYATALSPCGFCHLSLSDKRATDALAAVFSYVLSHGSDRRPVFTRLHNDDTFTFAEAFAESNEGMKDAFSKAEAAAAARTHAHWNKVLEKQKEASALRQQLEKLKADESPASFQIYSLSRDLESVLRPPPFLKQPYPKERSLTMRVLFFLHIPQDLRSLARLSFAANQMMVPEHRKDIFSDGRKWSMYSLRDHVKEFSGENIHADKSWDVMLVSPAAVPKAWGPESVDFMTVPSDGVWFPDLLPLSMGWKGGHFARDQLQFFFNPFVTVPDEDMVSGCSVSMPTEYASTHMQQAYFQWETDKVQPERGNVGPARLDARPPWLTKAQYLTFWEIRAYPNLQLRKICIAIRDKLLPLSNEAVQLLLRQALYHVGTLDPPTTRDVCPMLWKRDLTQAPRQGVSNMAEALTCAVDELGHRTGDHKIMLAIIDVVTYVAHWDDCTEGPFRQLRKRCLEVTMNWADDKELELSKAESVESQRALRALQTTFLLYAITTFEGSFLLGFRECGVLICLNVRISRYFSVCREFAPDKGHFDRLYFRSRAIMCARVGEVLSKFTFDMLTEAVRSIITRTPTVLEWKRSGETSFFEAVTSLPDEHLYNINILHGIVLFDGNPPGTLPHSIRQHHLYKRSFRERDFEVIPVEVKGQGTMLQTTQRSGEFYYDFLLDENDHLTVLETSSLGDVLELMDPAMLDMDHFPVRLRELCSHWRARTEGEEEEVVIVFRPVHYLDRKAHFILWIDNTKRQTPFRSEMKLECIVARIPTHDTSRGWRDLLKEMKDDEFHSADVLYCEHDIHSTMGRLLTTLAKFEYLKYLHVFKNAKAESIEVELPRYRLRFTVQLGTGAVLARDFADYRMSPHQQLEGTLIGFTQYLLLDHICGSDRPRLMIVPRFSSIPSPEADFPITFKENDACDATLGFCAFDIHGRFNDIRASTIESRLYLAAIYAATSTRLPEPRTQRTGEEQAVFIIRRCFTDSPLKDTERDRLKLVKDSVRFVPALYLLCDHLEKHSLRLAALHQTNPIVDALAFDQKFNDMATAYILECERSYCNPRSLLTPSEEMSILRRMTTRKLPSFALFRDVALWNKDFVEVDDDVRHHVQQCEQRLRALVEEVEAQSLESPSQESLFFENLSSQLSFNSSESRMWDEMARDLLLSHSNALKSTKFKLKASTESFLQIFRDSLKDTTKHRKDLETIFFEHFASAMPESISTASWYNTTCSILRSTNRIMIPTMADIMETFWAPSRVAALTPFVKMRSRALGNFKETLRTWMELCVLEDKLYRLVAQASGEGGVEGGHVGGDEEQNIITELLCTRPPSTLCSLWLPYEVDARIQIRPEQYAIAETLLTKETAISQLTMGKGKTRVIVPMLILACSEKKDVVLRIQLLPQLVGEGFDFLHQSLCGGLLNRKVFRISFNRDIKLNSPLIDVMMEHARLCKEEGGAIVLTPESCLSMMLKRRELILAGEDELARKLDVYLKLPWKDVLDETDEILHHKFQLIYAVGSRQQLPSLSERVQSAFAIIDAMDRNPAVRESLRAEGVCVREDALSPERFPPVLRLLPGAALKKELPMMLRQIATGIVENPPHEFKWMDKLSERCAQRQEDLKRYILDNEVNADEVIPPSVFTQPSHREVMLALRGWLSFGLAEHCWCQRHRVTFGVAHGPNRRGLAVPFRGCDAPAPRAEFAHPDITIMLTSLAYCYEGLNDHQLKEAIGCLLTLGNNAQCALYKTWFTRSFDFESKSTEDARAIDYVGKIDLSNVVQYSLLKKYYSHNVEVIKFWLLNCLFPSAMQEYPQRLKTSAWHLAKSNSIGFSGTTDNRLLWPDQVKYVDDSDPTLIGQNGKMMRLLEMKSDYALLHGTEWSECVELAFKYEASALIDAGALLAGPRMESVARHICERILESRSGLKGVVYFHDGEWRFMGTNKMETALSQSPVNQNQREAFVIFDEQHCRGADMKLSPRAKAILTIGPGMCKDKLLQAAGRLRQLDLSQSITIAAQSEIHRSVLELNGCRPDCTITVSHILKWIMKNTVKSAEDGLLEWATNGLHFAANSPVQDERHDLDSFYASKVDSVTVADTVLTAIARSSLNVGAEVASTVGQGEVKSDCCDESLSDRILDVVCERAASFGSNIIIPSSIMDNECERETELQQQKEEEHEREIKKEEPATEVDWPYDQALSQGWEAASTHSKAVPIDKFLRRHLKRGRRYSSIAWSEGTFYISQNFANTIAESNQKQTLDEYLRPIDILLLFSTGQVLILSDREANAILAKLWTTPEGGDVARLCHLSYERRPQLGERENCWRGEIRSVTATLIQLFNGETMFMSSVKVDALRSLLSAREAREVAQSFPQLRGNLHLLARSDLEIACDMSDCSQEASAEDGTDDSDGDQDSHGGPSGQVLVLGPDAAHHTTIAHEMTNPPLPIADVLKASHELPQNVKCAEDTRHLAGVLNFSYRTRQYEISEEYHRCCGGEKGSVKCGRFEWGNVIAFHPGKLFHISMTVASNRFKKTGIQSLCVDHGITNYKDPQWTCCGKDRYRQGCLMLTNRRGSGSNELRRMYDEIAELEGGSLRTTMILRDVLSPFDKVYEDADDRSVIDRRVENYLKDQKSQWFSHHHWAIGMRINN